MDELANLIAIGGLEEAEIANLVPGRVFHIRDNPFETLSDSNFIRTYRLSKQMVADLIEIVEPFIPFGLRRSALDVTTKVLTALNFFGYGSYQFNIAQNINSAVSQSSVSRSITEVTDALNRPEVINNYIHFPRNLEELQAIRNNFYHTHNFPGVIGCIDCTHIAIYPPPIKDNLYPEHIYVNRKGYHSINTQLICDPNLKIINISARFPGSTHDTYIWNNSNVLPFMESLHQHGHKSLFLLGDSGYPLRTYLLIPCHEAAPNSPEARYNARQMSTRSLIERCNGVLKLRFRCLLKHRVLHYSPERASKIINACAVLHNMCIAAGMPDVLPEPDDIDLDFGMFQQGDRPNELINNGNRNNPLNEGRRQRNLIIRNHFT